MKLVRYRRNLRAAWGILEDGVVRAVRGSVYGRPTGGRRIGRMEELDLLPPCEPTKVIGLGYNYKDLVGPRSVYEEPLVFLKPPSSVVSCDAPILLQPGIQDVWVEVEVAFVVRRGGRDIPADRAAEHILGYTIANDVTARNIHGRDHHLARSKGLDSFCPVGAVLDTAVKTDRLALSTTVNGRRTQQGSTANRILDDAACLALVSRYFTLAPGDLVLTGTPAGATDSVIRPGDRAVLEIAGLGQLANPILGGAQGEGPA